MRHKKLEKTDGKEYWESVYENLERKPYYLDAFLGEQKRQAHLDLIQRWCGATVRGPVLKTDLFEEAMGVDAFLTDLSNGKKISVGIDISMGITRKAKTQDASGKARYVAADVRKLPFKNNAFAFIISSSTLDHFSDPSDFTKSLGEIARILEPGGSLIVTLDNRQNIFDPLLRFVHWLGWVPYFLGRSYTMDELCAEVESVGLAVQEKTAILHNPRLTALAMVDMANRLSFPPFTSLVHSLLRASHRLEHTPFRYYTGSFIAVKAVKR